MNLTQSFYQYLQVSFENTALANEVSKLNFFVSK
jgi:hypothetical protein